MRFILYSFALMSISAIAVAGPTLQTLTSNRMANTSDWQVAHDEQGQFWLGYYDAGRRLFLRSPDGAERRIGKPELRTEEAPSGLAMAGMKDGVAFTWRDKQPVRALLLTLSNSNDDPREVGGDSVPLTRFDLRRLGDRLHLLWYGERYDLELDSRYNLYYRGFDAETLEPGPIEQVLPGFYPAWSSSTSGTLIVYSWDARDGKRELLARVREPSADGFAEQVKIADVPDMSPVLRGFRSADRHFVLWAPVYQDYDGPALAGAYSDDVGKTWTLMDFSTLDGYELTDLEIAYDHRGHIALGVGVTQPGKKHDIRLLRSSDNGSTWQITEGLRPQTVAENFRAEFPEVLFGATPGELILVWEDWREIRPRLYLSRSTDYGETWAQSNVPLLPGTDDNFRLQYGQRALYQQGQGFDLFASRMEDDSLRGRELVLLQFNADDILDLASAEAAGTAGDDQTDRAETAVRARIEAFWDAMLADDTETAYGLYDPFYRGRNTLPGFQSTYGRIDYTDYVIKDISLNGHIADVELDVTASIRPFTVPSTGERIERPSATRPLQDRWVWIDGSWYREYRLDAEDLTFTQY